MRLEIDFMDAINGVKKDIKVTYDAECPHCHGSGDKNTKRCTNMFAL